MVLRSQDINLVVGLGFHITNWRYDIVLCVIKKLMHALCTILYFAYVCSHCMPLKKLHGWDATLFVQVACTQVIPTWYPKA